MFAKVESPAGIVVAVGIPQDGGEGRGHLDRIGLVAVALEQTAQQVDVVAEELLFVVVVEAFAQVFEALQVPHHERSRSGFGGVGLEGIGVELEYAAVGLLLAVQYDGRKFLCRNQQLLAGYRLEGRVAALLFVEVDGFAHHEVVEGGAENRIAADGEGLAIGAYRRSQQFLYGSCSPGEQGVDFGQEHVGAPGLERLREVVDLVAQAYPVVILEVEVVQPGRDEAQQTLLDGVFRTVGQRFGLSDDGGESVAVDEQPGRRLFHERGDDGRCVVPGQGLLQVDGGRVEGLFGSGLYLLFGR